jgi:SAM-dependent methyltransferase
MAGSRPLATKRDLNDFQGKIGLEIGGPSPNFAPRGLLPIYAVAARIDNCNFSQETTWEGEIAEGATFRFSPSKAPGRQYIAEAIDLGRIDSAAYDFLLSSHAIEHTANPLKALGEWVRVVRPGGRFAIIVPHKDGTFDHRRAVTPLSHLIEDFERDVTEADLTHLDEILALHDLDLDPGSTDLASFKARSLNNLQNRCLHQHVFDTRSAVEMVCHAGLEIDFVRTVRPHDIVILAHKPPTGEAASMAGLAARLARARRASPFTSDAA